MYRERERERSTQTRGRNMLEFFHHETLQYPPVLAKGGENWSGTKSVLFKCILSDFTTKTIGAQPKATRAALEGSVLVNLVKPKKNRSFLAYSSEVFCPQIRKHQDLYVADRVDTHKEQSLKTATPLKRGKVESTRIFSGANQLERFVSFRLENDRIIRLLI